MTITATVGVPTTSWILMADSHKLSFSTIIMKTYLSEKPPYGICIGLGQLDLSKLFEKWTPLLLLPLATLYYLEPWWRKRSKRHLFWALNVKMAPMRPYFTQTNVHPIAIQSSHFHVPSFLSPLRMRLEWKTVWLFYLPCFDLSILLQNTLSQI